MSHCALTPVLCYKHTYLSPDFCMFHCQTFVIVVHLRHSLFHSLDHSPPVFDLYPVFTFLVLVEYFWIWFCFAEDAALPRASLCLIALLRMLFCLPALWRMSLLALLHGVYCFPLLLCGGFYSSLWPCGGFCPPLSLHGICCSPL